jgi:hypothetical protein
MTNLKITEKQAEELLLSFHLSSEFIDQSGCIDDDEEERRLLLKNIVDQIFVGFPQLEAKMISNKQKHLFSQFRD